MQAVSVARSSAPQFTARNPQSPLHTVWNCEIRTFRMQVIACRSYGRVVIFMCMNVSLEYKHIYKSVCKDSSCVLECRDAHAGLKRSAIIRMVLIIESRSAVVIMAIRHTGLESVATGADVGMAVVGR